MSYSSPQFEKMPAPEQARYWDQREEGLRLSAKDWRKEGQDKAALKLELQWLGVRMRRLLDGRLSLTEIKQLIRTIKPFFQQAADRTTGEQAEALRTLAAHAGALLRCLKFLYRHVTVTDDKGQPRSEDILQVLKEWRHSWIPLEEFARWLRFNGGLPALEMLIAAVNILNGNHAPPTNQLPPPEDQAEQGSSTGRSDQAPEQVFGFPAKLHRAAEVLIAFGVVSREALLASTALEVFTILQDSRRWMGDDDWAVLRWITEVLAARGEALRSAAPGATFIGHQAFSPGARLNHRIIRALLLHQPPLRTVEELPEDLQTLAGRPGLGPASIRALEDWRASVSDRQSAPAPILNAPPQPESPEHYQDMLREANRLMREQDYPGAERLLVSIPRETPSLAGVAACNALGDLYRRWRRYPEVWTVIDIAQQHINHLRALAGDDAQALQELYREESHALLSRADVTAQTRGLARALSLVSENGGRTLRRRFAAYPPAYLITGGLLRRYGQLGRAIALLSDAVRRFPGRPDVQRYLDTLMAQARQEGMSEEIIAQAPETAEPPGVAVTAATPEQAPRDVAAQAMEDIRAHRVAEARAKLSHLPQELVIEGMSVAEHLEGLDFLPDAPWQAEVPGTQERREQEDGTVRRLGSWMPLVTLRRVRRLPWEQTGLPSGIEARMRVAHRLRSSS